MIVVKLLKRSVLPLLLLLCSTLLFGQNSTVTGKVTDVKTGNGLAGVSIVIKGSTNGTSTNTDGNFSLQAPVNATLVFSFIGYETAQLTVTGSDASIALNPTVATQLNEVIVIGYGTARKKDLTGAVATVGEKDFQKGIMSTPEQMIAGKVAGVSITSNGGRPGAGSTIRIRGGSSLNASNDPLIVIDGVPLDNNGINGAANPLSFINPNDIESYTILKDASAAAIYGSRANNGVIIITTKKGKGGALKLNFSTVNSLSEVTKTIDVLNGDQVRNVVNNLGTDKQKSQLGAANTNWQDVIYQTGFGTDNNLSISGGLKNFPYRLTLGYYDQTGILRTDRLQKTSVSLAINPTFFERHLKVDINLKGAAQKTRFANSGAIGTAVGFDPTQPVYANDKRYGGYFEWREADGSLVLNRANNPLGLLEQTFDEQKPNRLIGNVQVDYKFHFLPELRANANVAYDISHSTGTYFVPDSAASNYLNKGSYSESKQNKRNSVFDFYLNYAKDLTDINSRVDFTVGYSYNNFYSKNYNFRGLNAYRDTIAGSSPPNFPFDAPENTLISYWGRLLYNISNKYFITASMRRDGSSRFSPENRWGWFPSVGLAWSIKGESFLENSNTVSELKLRFGYGLTGQQDGIGNYDYLGRYVLNGQANAYPFGDTYYLTYGPQGFNSALKWEELTSYNAAIDFGFLKDRINGSVDFYLRRTNDLLNSVPQATPTNFSAYVLANVGSLENKGVEVTLNLVPVKQTNVTWDLSLNATYNRNRITNLTVVPEDPNYKGLPTGGAEAVNGFVQLHQVGYARNTFNLYQQVYGKDGLPIEGLFEDRNRDGIINDDDRYLGKSAVPNYYFGFSTNLNYKKWVAGTVLRATLNNYMYNNIYSNRGRQNQVTGNYTLGNASTNYLTTNFVGNVDVQPLSDYYLENASFLRMDNLFLGYNFGRILNDKAALRLNASIQNVFVVTKYNGLDPEQSGGIDSNLYPRPRVYALTVNLDF